MHLRGWDGARWFDLMILWRSVTSADKLTVKTYEKTWWRCFRAAFSLRVCFYGSPGIAKDGWPPSDHHLCLMFESFSSLKAPNWRNYPGSVCKDPIKRAAGAPSNINRVSMIPLLSPQATEILSHNALQLQLQFSSMWRTKGWTGAASAASQTPSPSVMGSRTSTLK